jgi:hypothetical protein
MPLESVRCGEGEDTVCEWMRRRMEGAVAKKYCLVVMEGVERCVPRERDLATNHLGSLVQILSSGFIRGLRICDVRWQWHVDEQLPGHPHILIRPPMALVALQ